MPLSSSQLATLVERAKAKAPPPTPAPPPRPRQAVPAAPLAQPPATPVERPVQRFAPAPPTPRPVPPPRPGPPPLPPAKAAEPAAATETADNFPIGWHLNKESWHFHRKFYRLFRRPMRQGEYSFLLRQVWQRRGEHLGENYWRVTLPDEKTTLVVTATRWQLGTILPKGWEPAARRQECTENR